MAAIDCTNLTKTYKGKRGLLVEAVKGLNLTVPHGEIFGFLGPNGAGKSTTIKMLMGLIQPTSGHASLMGTDTASHLSRRRAGYLPENPSFYDYLTAEEYLAFVAGTFGTTGPSARQEIEKILKLLELWDARNRPIRGYSKGMVQRLGLAQTLIHDPDIYILDEPMSGLDPVGRALVKDIILDLKGRGKCVFFSTHITEDVETLCDRVGIIVQGTMRCVEVVQTILVEGIVEYRLRLREPGQMEESELTVPKEDLTRAMAEIQASGRELMLIEPKRRDLESFFLEIVKGKEC